MVETPSIWKFVVEPGVSDARRADDAWRQRCEPAEVAIGNRKVLHRFGRDRRGSLAGLRLNQRRFAGDRDGFGQRAQLDRHRRDATRSPGLTAMVLRSSVLNPSTVTLTVYVSGSTLGKVKSPVPADCVSMLMPRLSTDQRHRRAGNGRPLRVCDGPDDGAGGLRERGTAHAEDHKRGDHRQHARIWPIS